MIFKLPPVPETPGQLSVVEGKTLWANHISNMDESFTKNVMDHINDRFEKRVRERTPLCLLKNSFYELKEKGHVGCQNKFLLSIEHRFSLPPISVSIISVLRRI